MDRGGGRILVHHKTSGNSLWLCVLVLSFSKKAVVNKSKKKEENVHFHRMINCLVDLSLIEQCNN